MTDQQLLQPALRSWLDEATRDLAPEAVAMIGAEIEAHFLDAYDDAIAAGAGEAEAAEEALRRLGDPRRAHRAYRRQFPTERQYQRAQCAIDRRRRKPNGIPAALYTTALVWYAIQVSIGSATAPLALAAMLASLLAALIAYYRIRRGWLEASRDQTARVLTGETIAIFFITGGWICAWMELSADSARDMAIAAAFLMWVAAMVTLRYRLDLRPWWQMRRCREMEDPSAEA